MPGKESMTPKQNRILVEEGYEPRDVVNISFETEIVNKNIEEETASLEDIKKLEEKLQNL